MKRIQKDWHDETIITNGEKFVVARRLGRDARAKLLAQPGWVVTHALVDGDGIRAQLGSSVTGLPEQGEDIGNIDALRRGLPPQGILRRDQED